MWDIVWVLPQGHRSVSVSRHFLLQAPQCPCSVQKRFSRDHCCRGRSKPGCRIVGLHTRGELTTWADFQLCLHRILMSTGCKSSHSSFLGVSCSTNTDNYQQNKTFSHIQFHTVSLWKMYSQNGYNATTRRCNKDENTSRLWRPLMNNIKFLCFSTRVSELLLLLLHVQKLSKIV